MPLALFRLNNPTFTREVLGAATRIDSPRQGNEFEGCTPSFLLLFSTYSVVQDDRPILNIA